VAPMMTSNADRDSAPRGRAGRAAAWLIAAAGVTVGAGWARPRAARAARRRRAPTRLPSTGATVVPILAPPSRVVLLTSPHAGTAQLLDRARTAMRYAGIEILDEIPIAQHPRLTRWLADPGPLMVVAAGGDGTVGTAANYLAGTATVLGVLPLGTSNDVARSLGLPRDPIRAARLLAGGKIATIDTGRVTMPGQPPRHFVHAASAGVNVDFAKLATQASLRRRLGRAAYAVAAARALRHHQPFDCELRAPDGNQRLRLVHLSVVKAPVFGGVLQLRVPQAHLDDRHLAVIAIEHLPLRRLLLLAAQPVLRLRYPIRGVHTLRVRHLEVTASTPVELVLDGEVRGALPAVFDVAADALRVITPLAFHDIDDD